MATTPEPAPQDDESGITPNTLLLPGPALQVTSTLNPSLENPHPTSPAPSHGSVEIAVEKLSEESHAASQTSSHGIYWKSPLLMVSGWLGGLLFCVAHHLLYAHVDGDIVQSLKEQQWNIRAGSVFATLVQTLLTGAVWTAYTQWLWRTLRRTAVSLKGLDAAFGAETALWSLANIEVIIHLPVCLILGIIAWCLYIPSIFTPATLSIASGNNSFPVDATVRTLNISSPGMARNLAYFIPMNISGDFLNANSDSQTFVGPRSILGRLSTASTSMGEILPISPPFDRCSYNLSFAGPSIRCSDANTTARGIIDAVLEVKNNTWKQQGLTFHDAYYAFVPSPDSDVENGTTVSINGTKYTALDQPRLQGQPINATNELWLKYFRYNPDANHDGLLDPLNMTPKAVPQYLTCRLMSATYEVRLSFSDGEQNVTKRSVSLMNEVPYPVRDPMATSNLTQLAYTSLFMVLTDQLVGHMGIFMNRSTGVPQYGSIATNIGHNSLLGSNDLDYFFYQNSLVNPRNQTVITPQRKADKDLARNATLPELIQEGVFNITASLMENPILSQMISTTVERSVPVNRYFYDVRSLWLAYGIAVFFAFCAIIVGGVALVTNGSSHDSAVSTLISICRHESLTPIVPPCCHGKLPLPDETMKTKVRLIKNQKGSQEDLQVSQPGSAPPVCKTCRDRAEPGNSHAGESRRRSSRVAWMSSPRLRSQSQPNPKLATPSPTASPLVGATAR